MCIRFNIFIVKVYIALQNYLLVVVRFILFNPASRVEPRTILVYRTARLGDFIVAIPALATLRQRFPCARIVLLTTSSTALNMRRATQSYTGAQSFLPWLSLVVPTLVDEAVVIPLENWQVGFEQARRCVRDLRPEVTFVLPFSGEDGINRAKKILFLWLAGVHSPLYGIRIYSTTRFMREVQYRAGRFEHQVWGPLRAVMECPLVPTVDEKDVTFPLTIEKDAERWAQRMWEGQKWSGRRVVAVFPGGMFPHKRWPVEKFAQVCRTLQAQYETAFVVLGSSTDRDMCDRLCAILSTEIFLNLAGQTSLMQLAAVLKRCDLFVGNDSGPAHLASALGCPCITLTSSIEYPGWWEPWNSRNRTIRRSVPCQHCFSYTECPLGTQECIEAIEVSRVLATARSVSDEYCATQTNVMEE